MSVHPLELIEIAFGDVPAAYGANLLPAAATKVVQLCIFNDTNEPIYITTNGVDNHYYCGPQMTVGSGDQTVSDLRIKYQSAAPTSGNVYITPHVE